MQAPSVPKNEETRLAALDHLEILDTAPEQAYDDITKLAAHIFDAPVALVSLVDAERQWFKSRVGMPVRETSREISFCGHVVSSGERMIVSDSLQDGRFFDNPLVTGPDPVRFYAGIPLRLMDGNVMGTLCVIDHVARTPSSKQLELLEALARQVQSQLELRAQLKERAHAAQRISAFFEMNPDMLCIINQGYFSRLNPAWYGSLGWSREELLAKPVIDFVHTDDRETMEQAWSALASMPRQARQFEVRLQRRDRSFRWLHWRAGADSTGKLIYAVARDVTAQKQVDDMKSDFVAVVSHELRTPLTSIYGSLRLLQGGIAGDLNHQARRLVAIAGDNTDRLIRMVNEMLDLDKIEAGKLPLRLEKVEADVLIMDTIVSMQAVATQAEVTVHYQPHSLPRILVDRDRITQVLTNLLSNAIKFTPAGGDIHIRTMGRERQVRIEVEDSGPGIAQADKLKLFRKFQQIDSSSARTHGGTGLGLAISKALVDEHGGSIGVDSVIGAGATFWVELPTMATVAPRSA